MDRDGHLADNRAPPAVALASRVVGRREARPSRTRGDRTRKGAIMEAREIAWLSVAGERNFNFVMCVWGEGPLRV